jgi:anti-sigma B factor antagonist
VTEADADSHFMSLAFEKLLVIGSRSGQNRAVNHISSTTTGLEFRHAGISGFRQAIGNGTAGSPTNHPCESEKVPTMPTTSTSEQIGGGTIFSRETRGRTLILNPLIHLGSLHEPEIAHETAELLEMIVNRQSDEPANLVIDLAHGEYLGTAMLGAIVKLWKRVSQRGGRLALCCVSENVLEVLRVTKLYTVWPIYPSRDQALTSIGA